MIILTLLYQVYPAFAADTVGISGQLETGVSRVDLVDNALLPDQNLFVNHFNLLMKWQIFEPVKIVIGLDNQWVLNMETGERTFQSYSKRYFLDYAPQPETLVRLGKQKLTTGCGLFWNPTDFFNPTQGHLKDHSNDEAIEAIYIEQYLAGNTWHITSLPYLDNNYAYEVGMERVKPGYLIGLNLFNSEATKALGLNFATNIAEFGIYTEGALYREGDNNSWIALIGTSYFFDVARNGMIRLEYCHDQTPFVQLDFIGFSVSYNPNEKITLGGAVVWNAWNQSLIFVPTCKYIVNDNWEIQLKELTSPGPTNFTYVFAVVRFF
jgi:hypothetical protein